MTVSISTRYRGVLHEFELSCFAEGLGRAAWQRVVAALPRVDFLHRRLELRRALAQTADADNPRVGMALVADGGEIEYADERFGRQLDDAFPNWGGRRLPVEIEWDAEVERHGLSQGGLHFRVRRQQDHYQVFVRPERGHPRLTRREFDVVRLVARGMTFKEIGRELGIAPPTASTHLYKVYDKLQMSRRSDLIQWVRKQGE